MIDDNNTNVNSGQLSGSQPTSGQAQAGRHPSGRVSSNPNASTTTQTGEGTPSAKPPATDQAGDGASNVGVKK